MKLSWFTPKVGGGLELASACHIRVADESAFYALPEGTRVWCAHE